MSKQEINHKELLTFSNLASLEWEFVDLEAIKEGDYDAGQGAMEDISTQLNDLLTPEVFARRNAEGDIEQFVYMKDIDASEIKKIEEGQREIKHKEKEQGLYELRQKAGIAMEYLEKLELWEETDEELGTDEGQFLKEWEVIYGADNYQVVADYLDYKWESLIKAVKKLDENYPDDATDYETIADELSEKNPYRERDVIEEIVNKQGKEEGQKAILEFGYNAVKKILTVGTPKGNISSTLKIGVGSFFEIIKGPMAKTVKNIGSSNLENHFIPILLSALITSTSDPDVIITEQLEKLIERKVADDEDELVELVEEFIELGKENLDGKGVFLTEKLDMSSTGFRVLVLKNDKDKIVISYHGNKKNEQELMPEELDLLQMVYDKISRENSGAEITFTGVNRGAELSFINTLMADYNEASNQAVLFCNPLYDLKDYIYLKRMDLNSKYKSIREISFTNEIAGIASGTYLNVLIAFFITAGVVSIGSVAIMGVMVAILTRVLNYIINFFFNNPDSIYKQLEMAKIVERKKGIEGYITDEFIEKDYIESHFERLNNEIKLKKEHGVYLLINGLIPEQKELYISQQAGGGLKKEELIIAVNPKNNDACFKLEKKENGVYEIAKNISQSGNDDKGEAIVKLSDLTSKDQREIRKGYYFANILKILHKMQDVYQKQGDKIFKFIYPTDKGIKISQAIPDRVAGLKDICEMNEFVFLPFLDQKSGNIKDEIREDYIVNLIKSAIQHGVDIEHEDGLSKIEIRQKLRREIKFGLEGDSNDYSIQLDNVFYNQEPEIEEINEYLYQILSQSSSSEFNYYKLIVRNQLDKDKLEDYYFFKGKKKKQEEEIRFQPIGIKIKRQAESGIEYKYNYSDWMIGGRLAIRIRHEFDDVKIDSKDNHIEFEKLREEAERHAIICKSVIKSEKDPEIKCLRCR